jgi:transcriptional repressor NrdR
MRCPFCKQDDDKVIDSRAAGDGFAIRRRRQCLECNRRYTTYERIEDTPLRVIKKDGTRVPFDRKKVFHGLQKACEKRPVSTDEIENVTSKIEREIHEMFDREVKASFIGELVMRELKNLDQVAFVRFASVYREFKDITEFLEEVRPMLEKAGKKKKETPGGKASGGKKKR